MRSPACGRPQSIESLFADKTLNTANAYRQSISRVPAMTADETGQPTLVDFITGRYNGIVFSEREWQLHWIPFPRFHFVFLKPAQVGVINKQDWGGFLVHDYKGIIS